VAADIDDLRRRARELIDETREILDDYRAAVRRLRETVRQARRSRGVLDADDAGDDIS
jgi:hypothetical protein